MAPRKRKGLGSGSPRNKEESMLCRSADKMAQLPTGGRIQILHLLVCQVLLSLDKDSAENDLTVVLGQ